MEMKLKSENFMQKYAVVLLEIAVFLKQVFACSLYFMVMIGL